MKHLFFVLLLSFVLASCPVRDFSKPDILKQPDIVQSEMVSNLTTRELMEAYRYHQSLPLPIDTTYAIYLGNRGKDAVVMWIEDLENGVKPRIDTIFAYPSIIRFAYSEGGYDICSDKQMIDRAANALANPKMDGFVDYYRDFIGAIFYPETHRNTDLFENEIRSFCE